MDDVAGAAVRPRPELSTSAVAELHDREWVPLTRFLIFHGASWVEAQDAVQEAFTELCVRRVEVRHPRAWLRTVAYRCWLKRPVREAPVDDPLSCRPGHDVDDGTPMSAVEIGEEHRRVLDLLLALPPKQRAAMAWYLDGFPAAEIAEAMNISPAAVHQNLKRARDALRAALVADRSAGGRGDE